MNACLPNTPILRNHSHKKWTGFWGAGQSFVHDKVNKVTKRVAHLPADPTGEAVQITEYEYGVTAGSTSNVMDSLVASNNLLSRVKYPDESTGESGASSKYYVDYSYNRLGELRGVTDQNQTIRKFERDEQGRVLADLVDTITIHTGTNARNIDDTIRRIGYEYDSLGRMVATTSHTTTASSGNIRDEVNLEYTPLWQVSKVIQQHDGVVDVNSPTVEYVYTNADADGANDNYSRLTELRYPEDYAASSGPRDTLKYVYGATGSTNDRLSRVSSIEVNGLNGKVDGSSNPIMETLVSYDRVGLGLMAKTSVNVGSTGGWDVVQDRTIQHDGVRPAGAYPSFDRFGRVVSHNWVRSDTGPQSPPQWYADKPAYMEVTHSYDRSSNRLSYNDNREGSKLPDRTRTFTYDRLNRLTKELRPGMPVGSVYTPQHASQQWDLDALGNWESRSIDSDYDGDFIVSGGTNKDNELIRQNNSANEIDSGLQYDSRVYLNAVGSTYRDRSYDDNGNMTDERSGKALPAPGTLMAGQMHTYDAWNRLVKSEYLTTLGASTTISENTYNGLGWRTSKSFDAAEGSYDGLDQKRVYSYGADWRVLEERIDTDVSTNSDSAGGTDDDTDWISQQFWGIRYIDDAVAKRVDRDGDGDFVDADCTYWYQLTDTQFSVGVVLDQEGHVYERIEYDAYGVARHRYGGDTNGDGSYNFFDISGFFGVYSIGDTTNYHADFDVNCDGTIDTVDIGILSAHNTPAALPGSWLSDPSSTSGPDNSIGYAGYVFNHEREDYTVRNRVYDAGLGRWMTRDPIGYAGGGNLLEYVWGMPLNLTDPLGLEPGTGKSEDQQRKEMCEALKDGLDNDMPMDDFLKKYNPTSGEDTGPFFQTKINIPGLGEVDMDWAMTLADIHNRGYDPARTDPTPGVENLLQLFGRFARGVDPWVLYHLGKLYWIFEDNKIFSNDPALLAAMKQLRDRYRQQNELNAVDLAKRMLDGDVTLQDLYDALDCDELCGD